MKQEENTRYAISDKAKIKLHTTIPVLCSFRNTRFVRLFHTSMNARMSPALNGSSVVWYFEHDSASEIHDGIIFDFYMGSATIDLGSNNVNRQIFCKLVAKNYIPAKKRAMCYEMKPN